MRRIERTFRKLEEAVEQYRLRGGVPPLVRHGKVQLWISQTEEPVIQVDMDCWFFPKTLDVSKVDKTWTLEWELRRHIADVRGLIKQIL